MIQYLLNEKYRWVWILFHFALGVISTFVKAPLIGWIYFVLLMDLMLIVSVRESVTADINALLCYIVSFEVLCRMARTSPIIPYEMGKYIMFILLMIGIIYKKSKGQFGWLMLLLVVPAAFYDFSGQANVANLVFNGMGCVNIALGVVYFRGQVITRRQLMDLLSLIVYPLISSMAYVIIKTPDYDEIDFTLSANFTTSGGFGSNQVSTILGLGIFLVFLLSIAGKMFTQSRLLDLGLMLGFAFLGLFTFSRGGMLGAGLGISAVLGYLLISNSRSQYIERKNLILFVAPLALLIAITFQIANDITGDKLSQRYQGETEGTLIGARELDINVLTTNRYDIFMEDFGLWLEHPISGNGLGSSMYLRSNIEDTAAHVELSRLLAEHGVAGIIFFLILLSFPYFIVKNNHDPLERSFLLALYLVAMFSTFHAALRTFVTPLLLGLSQVNIYHKDVHRKIFKPRIQLPWMKKEA